MNILIIASHPDDEVLGVGGTAFDLSDKGASIYYIIMTKATVEVHGKERVEMLREEAREVHKYLPSSETFFYDFPSLNLDTVPKRDINHAIEEVVQKIKPSIVFVHSANDINHDHRLVSEATAVACRPYTAPFVKHVYCYEVMSATEWPINANANVFIPICYNDITKYLDKKLKALSMYKSQEKPYPHTRSVRSVENHARYRGNVVGVEAAECFYPLLVQGIDI